MCAHYNRGWRMRSRQAMPCMSLLCISDWHAGCCMSLLLGAAPCARLIGFCFISALRRWHGYLLFNRCSPLLDAEQSTERCCL